MEDNIEFIYEKEFWYVSAFINTNNINIVEKTEEIKGLIVDKLKALTDIDLKKISWNKEWVEIVKELGREITIENINWNTFIEGFPFFNENTNLEYNTLGYFEFEVEYYKNNPTKKESIKPIFIQQIPTIISNLIKEFCDLKENEFINIDKESPIYIYVISDALKDNKIVEWTEENVLNYKRKIGNWTEIYTGSWPDYNELLYNRRIQGNLSNRLSELHFIRRNSGFIYMKEENYKMFFNSYMKEYVLEPTARIRSMLFALISINESLDILFSSQISHISTDIEILEDKMKKLKLLRGRIQTQMSIIYNELDYNRRQHYTAILKYLIEEFDLKTITKRIFDKYEVIYDSMNMFYQKQNEENQEKTERGMNILNLLFGVGVVADLTSAIIAFSEGFVEGNILSAILNGIVSLIITIILGWTLLYFGKSEMEKTKKKIPRKTVDAVIIDNDNNILLIRRRFSPFKGQLALPGGFIEENENYEQAVVREVREELGLKVRVEKQIGFYDQKGRDPRGNIVSTAFLCKLIDDISNLEGNDEAIEIEFRPINQMKGLNLAFDHEDIVQDALKL